MIAAAFAPDGLGKAWELYWQLPAPLLGGTAILTLVMGGVYLLFGLQAFRLISTIQAGLAGVALGAIAGMTCNAGMAIICGVLLGGMFAAVVWITIRYLTAIVFAVAFLFAGLCIVYFPLNVFLALIAALAVGLTVYRWYSLSIMVYTAVNGSWAIVVAVSSLLAMADPKPWQPRWGLELICTLMLATPGFVFQFMRYHPTPARKSRQTLRVRFHRRLQTSLG